MFKNMASFFYKEFIFYSLTIYIPVFLFFLAIVFEPTILPSRVSFSFLVLWIITGSMLQTRTFKLQRQMKLLFDSMPFISILVDKKGRYVCYNKQFDDLLEDGSINFNLSLENFHDIERKIMENKEILISTEEIEFTNKDKHWLHFVRVPSFNSKGEVENIAIFARYVDDEISLEERKNNFLAMLVHDLKNPIIAQSKAIELFIQGMFGEINDTQKEILEQMYRSSRFEMDMVMTVLDTYKLDSGNIKFAFKELNIVDNLKDVCFEFTRLLDRTDEIDIKLNVYNNTIIADQMHIRRVMYNLISNALKYKKEGTKIIVELSEDENNFKFSVINEGVPYSEKELEQFFERYYTKESMFQRLSTGLGLYLSKQIIEAHNGKMIAQSTKDGINTFGFTLNKVNMNDDKYSEVNYLSLKSSTAMQNENS